MKGKSKSLGGHRQNQRGTPVSPGQAAAGCGVAAAGPEDTAALWQSGAPVFDRVSCIQPTNPVRNRRSFSCHNHQRTCQVDLRLFRQIARALLDDLLTLPTYDLDVSLLADPAMTRLNEQFVHHAGSTDVITFDYTDPPPPASGIRHPASGIHGELFLCPDEALRQARRFRTTWQSELVRYLVHGVLHLLGHDDQSPALRRRMKRAENQLLRALTSQFPLERLERPARRSADTPVRLGVAQPDRADKNVRAPGRPDRRRPAEQSL